MKRSLKGLLLVPCALSFAAFAKSPSKQPEFVPNEVIVKLKPGMEKAFFSQKSLGSFLTKSFALKVKSFWKVKVDGKTQLAEVIAKLNQDPSVEYAEPNYIYRIGQIDASDPIDPKFGVLWGLKNSGNNEPGKDGNPTATVGVAGADVMATKAWEITKGSKQIKIAIIDTGIDYTHPDLKDNIFANEAEKNGQPGVDDDKNGYVDDVYGYDFANNDADPMDGHSHGTHCAGTIAASHNDEGVTGVMAEASLIAVKFLSDSGSGSTEGAINAIDYAIKRGVDIMSNSWGGGGYSKALEDVIKKANDAGIVFVAAAGNDSANNDNTPHYPSNYPIDNVISVAAHQITDDLASFSCFGKKTVHIAAPGKNIMSTVAKGGYAVYSGTSMATPHVSGVVGLLLSQDGSLTPKEVRTKVMATSIPVRSYKGKTVSGGRISAYNLLTNTIPPRNEPDPSAWVKVDVETFESAHPYANSASVEKSFSVPGAKYIRLVVDKYDLENSYDYLSVTTTTGSEVDKISGAGTSYQSEMVEGDTLKVKFISDSSVNKWGFVVKSVEVIR